MQQAVVLSTKNITEVEETQPNQFIVICCGIEMARQQTILPDGEVNWFMGCPICKRTLFVQQIDSPTGVLA